MFEGTFGHVYLASLGEVCGLLLRLRTPVTLCIVLIAIMASTRSTVSATGPQESNYQVFAAGALQVNFNSVQMSTLPPQAYSFGVVAITAPGLSIIRLLWQFGDGSILDVPYCCQSQVSEVRYHAYAQEGSYTVVVVAYDNAGNFGNAVVMVNWTTPVPEFSFASLSMIVSFLIVLAVAASLKGRSSRIFPSY